MSITRPILRYHGGKFLLAPWIISNFPEHRIYVEAYGGAASVLLQKPRSYAEVYNDLDDEVVNLFKVIRNSPHELIRTLKFTPFARDEFELSYQFTDDPIEQARRTIIRSFMGFGSGIQSHQRTGFRGNSNRSGTTPAHDWQNYPESLTAIIDRMRGVVIENRNGIEVMKQHDTPETLHYLDPPYHKDTRYKGQKTRVYKHEMEDFEHEEMLDTVLGLSGMVVVSGYDNEMYNDVLNGYSKVSTTALADGARERTEVLWISPNCDNKQLKIF